MPKVILDKVLKKQGISKRRFAKMIGMSYPNVFRLFRSGTDPRFSALVKWAKALKIKVRELIED
jgi:transcriptional regulator with XRE-family HTH domain